MLSVNIWKVKAGFHVLWWNECRSPNCHELSFGWSLCLWVYWVEWILRKEEVPFDDRKHCDSAGPQHDWWFPAMERCVHRNVRAYITGTPDCMSWSSSTRVGSVDRLGKEMLKGVQSHTTWVSNGSKYITGLVVSCTDSHQVPQSQPNKIFWK